MGVGASKSENQNWSGMRLVFRLFTVGALLLTVSGCSASGAPQHNPTVSQTPTSSATQAPKTPAEAKAAFAKIAEASCNQAQKLGAVESSKNFTVVAVNKNEGYKDYSAAYLESPENYGLIWELDALIACADSFTFSMAEEAGQEAEIDVTFDAGDGTYTTFEDFGEYGTSNYKFTVRDGMFSTAENLDPKNHSVTAIRYGGITSDDLAILHRAVDEYLAKN